MYGKIFASMYDGTLCTKGPWEALVTFQQLIVLAEKDGSIDMTPEAISRRTTIPLAVIKTGLAALAHDDPESRSPAEDGRRIMLLSAGRAWGWRIVNYAKYRAIRTAEERREYMRQYMQEYRKPDVSNVNDVSPVQPIAVSSKQYAEEEKKKTRPKTGLVVIPPDFLLFWSEYPKKVGRKAALEVWNKLNGHAAVAVMIQALAVQKLSEQWRMDGGQFIPHASKWLREERWTDEPLAVAAASGNSSLDEVRRINAELGHASK